MTPGMVGLLVAAIAFAGGLIAIMWNGLERNIELNARCPGCGHRSGALKFGMLKEVNAKDETMRPMITHTCQTCGATWAEAALRPEVWTT